MLKSRTMLGVLLPLLFASVTGSGQCPDGQYATSNYNYGYSNVYCYDCYPGTYDDGSGMMYQCVYCPAGTAQPYFAAVGAATCTSCPPGTYSYSGSSYCNDCYPGYYCPTTTALYECPLGRYGDSYGLFSSSCSGVCSASAGSYCGTAMTSPTGIQCSPGQYSSTAGATSCTSCPAGRYGMVSVETKSTCTAACPAGRWAPAGSSECLPCALGRYGNATGATTVMCTGQ
jgi:hypothetical protein